MDKNDFYFSEDFKDVIDKYTSTSAKIPFLLEGAKNSFVGYKYDYVYSMMLNWLKIYYPEQLI